MALVLGLDIGTKTLTGAVFSGKPGSFRMVDFFVEEIPSIASHEADTDEASEELDTPRSLENFLADVVKDRGLGDADVVAAIDTKECIVREFPVPFTRDDQISKTVFFEAESHFPGVDLEEVTLEYLKVGEFDGKSQLIVWALANDKIEARLKLVQSLRMDPVALDIDVAALFNAFALTADYDENRTTLLVEMGITSTRILLVEGGKLLKVRALRLETMPVGGERLIPEPVEVGAATGESADALAASLPESAGGLAFDEVSLEVRFEEIEAALARLDAVEEPSSEDDGHLPGEDDPPIAIVTDEEYDMMRGVPPSDGTGGDTAEGGGAAVLALTTSEGAETGTGESPEAPEGADFKPRFPGGARTFDYSQYLERIALEIQRSMAGVRLSSPIELICLTGGMSGRDEARSYFSDEFNVETIDLDFGDAFPTDLAGEKQSEVGRVGAVAVGLATKRFADKSGLDFRKGAFRYEAKLEKLRFPLLVAAAMVFLISLQGVFWAIQSWKEENQRLAKFQNLSAETYAAFFGKKMPGGADALVLAERQSKKWLGQGVGRNERFLDAADAVHSLGKSLKDARLEHFEVKTMKIELLVTFVPDKKTKKKVPKQGRSRVQLLTPDKRALRKLQIEFDKPDSIYQVSSSEANRGDARTVTLELTLKGSKLRQLQ